MDVILFVAFPYIAIILAVGFGIYRKLLIRLAIRVFRLNCWKTSSCFGAQSPGTTALRSCCWPI